MADGTNDNSVDWVTFGIAFGIIVIFCIAGAAVPELVAKYAGAALSWVITNFGWLFILLVSGFVVFAVILAFSRYGSIPLAASEDEKPEFSTVSWVAMMFSAGMGIGLMFYGVYEPVAHLSNLPPAIDAEPGTSAAARMSMAYTFFHWGLHPWAIYAVVALALAYSTYRKGRGNLISSPFQGLLGRERIEDRGWGRPIDIWAIIATKFGGATSLGLGALQIASGLVLVFGTGEQAAGSSSGSNNFLAIIVIVVLVAFALLSAVSGVGRGIKWLSNTNMVLAVLLALFLFFAGSTVFILNLIPASFGAYIYHLIPMSLHSPAFGGLQWMSSWTIFYWAWWISWAPFVATFIARVSRGRTIREFVIAVLIVPSTISALWFVFVGGSALDLVLSGVDLNTGSAAAAFFDMLQHFPFFSVTGAVVMFLTAIFWVSGADASALVLGILSSRGALEPKNWLIALWAVASAFVAGILILVGGLSALQTFTILVATPFLLVMVGLCWGLYADLRRDPLRQRVMGTVHEHVDSEDWPDVSETTIPSEDVVK